MTPDELATLDDDAFFAYLAALDRQPDAPAQVLTDAWSELERRRVRIDARMREECAAAGMTAIQIDRLKQRVRQVFGVREEEGN